MTAKIWGDLSLAGALAGLLFACGLTLVLMRLPVNRQPGLDERMGPYLRDAMPPSSLLARRAPQSGFVMALGRILGPAMADSARWLERILGGGASVRRRLLRAGQVPDVDAFRAEQVVWGVVGGAGGLGLAILFMATRGAGPAAVVALVFVGVVGGVVLRDQRLTAQADSRERQMLAEFPTVAELLALAVAAGEGATGALERVCRLSRGELARELRMCLADARAGANLPAALAGLADRTGLVSLSRFVDGMVVAVERGTPLAEVLRAQAQDVRETGRRAVMEAGGKKEISMMIPVVFLVLPVTILFAIFPGLVMFQINV